MLVEQCHKPFPNSHIFDRCGIFRPFPWVVYDIVLPTLILGSSRSTRSFSHLAGRNKPAVVLASSAVLVNPKIETPEVYLEHELPILDVI